MRTTAAGAEAKNRFSKTLCCLIQQLSMGPFTKQESTDWILNKVSGIRLVKEHSVKKLNLKFCL